MMLQVDTCNNNFFNKPKNSVTTVLSGAVQHKWLYATYVKSLFHSLRLDYLLEMTIGQHASGINSVILQKRLYYVHHVCNCKPCLYASCVFSENLITHPWNKHTPVGACMGTVLVSSLAGRFMSSTVWKVPMQCKENF